MEGVKEEGGGGRKLAGDGEGVESGGKGEPGRKEVWRRGGGRKSWGRGLLKGRG